MDNSFDLPPPFVSEGITKILLGENINGGLFSAEQLRAAVEAEREACAVTAWSAGMDAHTKGLGLMRDARDIGSICAREIRERGKS